MSQEEAAQSTTNSGGNDAQGFNFREFVVEVIEQTFVYREKEMGATVLQRSICTFATKIKGQQDLKSTLEESAARKEEAATTSKKQEEDYAVLVIRRFALRTLVRLHRQRNQLEQASEADQQEREYSSWLIQKSARRMLWRLKQQRGELGIEYTDSVNVPVVRHAATIIQAHYRSFAVRRDVDRRPHGRGVQARREGGGTEYYDDSDEEEEDEDGAQDPDTENHDRQGEGRGSFDLDTPRKEPFSVETMWTEKPIDIKDTRSEERKIRGRVLQSKYWPLGAPKYPAPRFARAFLQEVAQLEGREAFLRRSVTQAVDQQRAQFGLIHKKLQQLLASELEDRQRVVRREGRFRQLIEEEVEIHWGAIVRLDLALRWGDQWADTYAELVTLVVNKEVKVRKDVSKEELSVRANLAVREYKSRRQVMNLKSSFSSIRPHSQGGGGGQSSTSVIAIRGGTMPNTTGVRGTSSLQNAKSYSASNTGFSKVFDNSLIHLRSRRAIQRLENLQTSVSRAEEVRQENQLFEQTLTDDRHYTLSTNYARAIKQRDETKARRKVWLNNRAHQLEELRYEAKVDEFSGRRLAYEMRNKGGIKRNPYASPELHQQLLLPGALERSNQEGQLTPPRRALSRQGHSRGGTRVRTAVHTVRRSQTALDTYPGSPQHEEGQRLDYGGQLKPPPTAGTTVSRSYLQTPTSKTRSPGRGGATSPFRAGGGQANTLLPLEAKLVALVEQAYARDHSWESGGGSGAPAAPDQNHDVRKLMSALPGEPSEQAASAVDRILTWNRHAVRLMQNKNPSDPILGTNPGGAPLDQPLNADPLKAASQLLKSAAAEVKAVAQHLRLQHHTKKGGAAQSQPISVTKKKKGTKEADTEGNIHLSQIALLISKLDLIVLNNQSVYARSTQQLRLAAKYLQDVMTLEETGPDGKPSVGTLLNTSAVLVQLEEPSAALEYARSAEKRLCESLTTLLAESLVEHMDGQQQGGDSSSATARQQELRRCMMLSVTALHNVAIAQSVCPAVEENSVSDKTSKYGSAGDSLLSPTVQRGSLRVSQKKKVNPAISTAGATQVATATERNACRRTFQRSQEIADIVLGSQHPLSVAILKSSARVAATLVKH